MTVTTARTKRNGRYPRGSQHHNALYDEQQIALAKRLLLDAERVEMLAPGERARIAAITGLSDRAVRALLAGVRWTHIEPAPATEEHAS